VVISQFTDNRAEYLLFEFMTNQVSHALSLIIDEAEPIIYEEAINGSEFTAWKHAMQEEFDSLIENQTWQLIELPPGSKVLGGR
jgi:hypothetical protein